MNMSSEDFKLDHRW